ncbi:DUF2252 domain-containing protein [Nakamurella sp.]|uniref:DUF2252 domain-containing protein n=1 Tax=Nakamurella sp. TaxID=1869182 RepID=UPI003784D1CD
MATPKVLVHLSVADRQAKGADARERTPLESHLGWTPAPDRFDPVALLEEQNTTREPDLVPVRHGRMAVSPFTFYRGAAKIMAADLATTPTAGLNAQLCGDAHLSNFGGYASPERRLVFDLNDFDETLPGPVEYDVKRLAASFVIAGRNNGFSPEQSATAALTAIRRYRTAMSEFAAMGTMELWYSHLSEDDLKSALGRLSESAAAAATDGAGKGKAGKAKSGKGAAKARKDGGKGKQDRTLPEAVSDADVLAQAARRAQKGLDKARTRDSLQALSKLGELVDGRYRIKSQPPIVVPLRDFQGVDELSADNIENVLREQFREYRASLEPDRRHVLENFAYVDMARKVVGVGSVGTRAFIVLLEGRDMKDPLFLQVKEATRSVLEDHLPASKFANPGERVVRGQRMMQATSDIFLGWTKGIQANRYYYWRQLRDMKTSAVIESMTPAALAFYADLCGWTLARAHARSGDVIALAAYLGDSDVFETGITDFAVRYADQNEVDYQAFTAAIDSGRLPVRRGL